METLSKQLGELTAIRSMLEVELEASKKELRNLRDEIDRLTKLLNEASSARDAAVRHGLDLQSQLDRALLEKSGLEATLAGTNTHFKTPPLSTFHIITPFPTSSHKLWHFPYQICVQKKLLSKNKLDR